MTRRKVDLDEAAGMLKLSKDAVRKRIQRGTIAAERDLKGKWWVTIEDEQPDVDRTQTAILQKENEMLKEQLEELREQLNRRDRLLWEAMQKIPQLEAPQEQQPSWWKRLFRRG